jgi:hypothetical protein
LSDNVPTPKEIKRRLALVARAGAVRKRGSIVKRALSAEEMLREDRNR